MMIIGFAFFYFREVYVSVGYSELNSIIPVCI